MRTYGDFQETYQESDPDFFVHIAEKSLAADGTLSRPTRQPANDDDSRAGTEAYYDSDDAERLLLHDLGRRGPAYRLL